MSMIDDIKRDISRPQVKEKSGEKWTVLTDGPAPGWVQVCGPAFKVDGPTTATDLNGQDYVARLADARRIARVPSMETALIAADELAEAIEDHELGAGNIEEFTAKSDRLESAMNAYRAATGGDT